MMDELDGVGVQVKKRRILMESSAISVVSGFMANTGLLGQFRSTNFVAMSMEKRNDPVGAGSDQQQHTNQNRGWETRRVPAKNRPPGMRLPLIQNRSH
jgi:hypothetical protein